MVRIIDHLRELGMSSGEARKALGSGKVRIKGVPTADAGREAKPQDIEYAPRAPRLTPGRDLAIIHHDADVAVVWKPANMLSVAAPGRGDEPNVVSLVARILRQAHPVHRLDEGTSGLLLVALNQTAQLALKEQFADHSAERRYLALVRHTFPITPERIESTFVRNRGDGLRGSVEAHPAINDDPRLFGQEERRAVSSFALQEALPGDCSLVNARLETGRTHQVRIHLAERGFPVLGDPLYGRRGSGRAFPRLALHAAIIGFTHPSSGERLRFESAMPDDIALFRRQVLSGQSPWTSTPKIARKKGRKRKGHRKKG